jgi:hypothetical protein
MNKTLIIFLLLGIILLYIYSYPNQVFIFKNGEQFTFPDIKLKSPKRTRFSYVYQDNFMDPKDFQKLLCELKKYDDQLDKSKEETPNVIRYNLKMESPIVINLIKKYENKIKSLTKNYSLYLAKNFPIEYRKYVPGSFMAKHRDVLIYKLPQYECVFTLSNSTDSYTDVEGKKIKSKPNSLIILKANGVEHEVTKVTTGERKFLKFIFTETDEFAKK